jgi:drug/metabolite transporter (DMT)-like permease
MVAYLLPVVGIALGAIVLREAISVTTVLGTVLVIGGIALVNSKYGARPLFRQDEPAVRDAAAPTTGRP